MMTAKKAQVNNVETPNLDRILAVQKQSHAIAEFVDFLKARGYAVQYDVQEELAKFFGIDTVKAELERNNLWALINTKN